MEFVFEIFEKLKKKLIEGSKVSKKIIFTKKMMFFLFEFVLYFFLALFLGILLSFIWDVQILNYFCLKCLFFCHRLWQPSWQKTMVHKDLFLVPLEIKKLDTGLFWALKHHLMLQNWLKLIKGHNGPVPALNIIAEPCRNRVN